jgi:hypothetical protein
MCTQIQLFNYLAKLYMRIENGKWKMENGKWKMENGKCPYSPTSFHAGCDGNRSVESP